MAAVMEKHIFLFDNRFIVKDRCTSYCSSQRSLMVMQVLLRTKYDDSEKVWLLLKLDKFQFSNDVHFFI